MITGASSGHGAAVETASTSPYPSATGYPSGVLGGDAAGDQPVIARPDIGDLLRDHFDFVWRALRRLGLDASHADDAAQEVFLVAAKKIDAMEAGRERSFLFGTAMRVAADARKKVSRRREVGTEGALDLVDPAPSPEALVDQHRARALLDELLDELPQELRAIFVLYELEELEMQEIASLLALPPGTVASRLRRARGLFNAASKRRQARVMMLRGGGR